MATFGGPNIVTDGLVFYVDPANTDSYISGSETTFSLFQIFLSTYRKIRNYLFTVQLLNTINVQKLNI